MVFSAVSMVSSFEADEDTDDLVSGARKHTDTHTHNCMLLSLTSVRAPDVSFRHVSLQSRLLCRKSANAVRMTSNLTSPFL